MFRLSQYLNELRSPTCKPRHGQPPGPVVIWNLVRRCNLTCKHCYSISADINFPGELNTQQIFTTMDDLKGYSVPVLILSGGEPLLRPDIFDISHRAKSMGFYVGLSTNGTLITEENIQNIKDVDYNYVGISVDGMRETHDEFRQKKGAFDASLNAIRLCRDAGIKVGMRFTPTQDTAKELPALLELMEREDVNKFYLSHLNYSGRGNKNRKSDAFHQTTRWAMNYLFKTSWKDIEDGNKREYVTGNNDADGVYMLDWIKKNHPQYYNNLYERLVQWGGNSSGVNISNIDNLGNVHPDTFWWNYNLGNVKDQKFSDIWNDTSDPLMAGLKSPNRPLRGRCGVCNFKNICGGNTRVRAFQTTSDPWWEDPGCYLSDEELNITAEQYENQKPQPINLKTRVIRLAS